MSPPLPNYYKAQLRPIAGKSEFHSLSNGLLVHRFHIKIEITQFSKLLLEIFGIDSELNYDLIVVQPIFDLGLQKIWRPNSEFFQASFVTGPSLLVN